MPQRTDPPRDVAIARLAETQHGVVSSAQLVGLGLGARAVRGRVASGRFHRLHRGVFAVGRPGITREGRYLAAVLACGDEAALSHRSAAAHLDLVPTGEAVVDVTVPRQAGRRLRSVRAHCAASLPADAVTTHAGVPTTTIARTIFDLADSGHRRAAERAIDRADEVHRYDFTALRELILRSPRRRGARVVAALLDHPAPPSRTRSDLEEAFVALCDSHGLPRPHVNMWIAFAGGGGALADFCWPEHSAIVETDSLTYHRTQSRMSHDYLRDQRLELLGWRVRRVGWDQVFDTPAHIVRVTRGLLG